MPSVSTTYVIQCLTDGQGVAQSGNLTGSVLVTVSTPTPAITGLASAYCKDAVAVTLTGTPAGGSFTIDKHPATQLSPASLSAGPHTVRYTVTVNGCTAFTEQSVEVKALPMPTITGLASAYCKDAAAVTLTATPAGGQFTIDSQPATQLNPASLSAGPHIVRYIVTVNGCAAFTEQSVEIKALPTPAITGLASAYCKDAAAVTLTATPAGGQFTIDSQPATQLNPASLPAGPHTVRYTVTVNGCTAFTERSVQINALPTVDAGNDRSVILGFGGVTSNCTTLTATAIGGSGGGYNYSWTLPGSLNGQTVTVCPQQTTIYTVTVTDANGCSSPSDKVIVNVQDVRCGPGDKSVTICYYGVTQCVSEKVAERYLKLGARLGGCGGNPSGRVGVEEISGELPLQLSLKAYPNPVQDAVRVGVLAPTAGAATIEVLDVTGRVRQSRSKYLQEGLNEVKLGLGSLPTGIYLIRATDALGRRGVVRVSRQ